MNNAERAMNSCAVNPHANGTLTSEEVEEVVDTCGARIMCHGYLRDIIFTEISPTRFRYHTEDWYDKHSGKR